MKWLASAVDASVCGVGGNGGPVQATTMGVLTQPTTEGPTHGNLVRNHKRRNQAHGHGKSAYSVSGVETDDAGQKEHPDSRPVDGSVSASCGTGCSSDAKKLGRPATTSESDHDSSLAISGLRLTLGIGLCEVWPNQPKVVRAQVLARHSAARRSFDGHAIRWARSAVPRGEIADGGLTDADCGSESPNTAEVVDGAFKCIHTPIITQVIVDVNTKVIH